MSHDSKPDFAAYSDHIGGFRPILASGYETMTIGLRAQERPPTLRRFVEDLSNALNGHARVWASLVAGDEGTAQSVTVFVDVYDVTDQDAAFERVAPVIGRVDPHQSIVRLDASRPSEVDQRVYADAMPSLF